MDVGHVAPARVAVPPEAGVMLACDAPNPLLHHRLRLFRREPRASDLTAEILVA
ncbi:hypothetical protein ACU4HD_11150 [Cupriavidus basilensis]